MIYGRLIDLKLFFLVTRDRDSLPVGWKLPRHYKAVVVNRGITGIAHYKAVVVNRGSTGIIPTDPSTHSTISQVIKPFISFYIAEMLDAASTHTGKLAFTSRNEVFVQFTFHVSSFDLGNNHSPSTASSYSQSLPKGEGPDTRSTKSCRK